MDPSTLNVYDTRASDFAGRYAAADVSPLHRLLLAHLPTGGRLLEIGCGAGRDAVFLAKHGFDVVAADASAAMLAQAQNAPGAVFTAYPYSTGWGWSTPVIQLLQAAFPLPAGQPLLTDRFDAILALAVIMHLPDADLFEFACQVRQMLTPGGTLVLSISEGRTLDPDSRDPHGRLFRERPPAELSLLFERLGFGLVTRDQTPDSLGRADIRWTTLVLRLDTATGSRPVDQIETIINRDKYASSSTFPDISDIPEGPLLAVDQTTQRPLSEPKTPIAVTPTTCSDIGEFNNILAGLGVRARHVLLKYRIHDEAAVLSLTETQLQKFRNCGKKTVSEIVAMQLKLRSLRQPTPDSPPVHTITFEHAPAEVFDAIRGRLSHRAVRMLDRMAVHDFVTFMVLQESQLLQRRDCGKKTVRMILGLQRSLMEFLLERARKPADFRLEMLLSAPCLTGKTTKVEDLAPDDNVLVDPENPAPWLKDWIRGLAQSEKLARVYMLRMGMLGATPLSLESIAQEFGITRERVRQMTAKIAKNIENRYQQFRLRPLAEATAAIVNEKGGLVSLEELTQAVLGRGKDGNQLKYATRLMAYLTELPVWKEAGLHLRKDRTICNRSREDLPIVVVPDIEADASIKALTDKVEPFFMDENIKRLCDVLRTDFPGGIALSPAADSLLSKSTGLTITPQIRNALQRRMFERQDGIWLLPEQVADEDTVRMVLECVKAWTRDFGFWQIEALYARFQTRLRNLPEGVSDFRQFYKAIATSCASTQCTREQEKKAALLVVKYLKDAGDCVYEETLAERFPNLAATAFAGFALQNSCIIRVKDDEGRKGYKHIRAFWLPEDFSDTLVEAIEAIESDGDPVTETTFLARLNEMVDPAFCDTYAIPSDITLRDVVTACYSGEVPRIWRGHTFVPLGNCASVRQNVIDAFLAQHGDRPFQEEQFFEFAMRTRDLANTGMLIGTFLRIRCVRLDELHWVSQAGFLSLATLTEVDKGSITRLLRTELHDKAFLPLGLLDASFYELLPAILFDGAALEWNAYLLTSLCTVFKLSVRVVNDEPSPYTVTAMVVPDDADLDNDVVAYVVRHYRETNGDCSSPLVVFEYLKNNKVRMTASKKMLNLITCLISQ
jgi:SAM-dependent methyltransferase